MNEEKKKKQQQFFFGCCFSQSLKSFLSRLALITKNNISTIIFFIFISLCERKKNSWEKLRKHESIKHAQTRHRKELRDSIKKQKKKKCSFKFLFCGGANEHKIIFCVILMSQSHTGTTTMKGQRVRETKNRTNWMEKFFSFPFVSSSHNVHEIHIHTVRAVYLCH